VSLGTHLSLVIGLLLALATAAAFNWSWVAQHTITSQLPPLSIRRPRQSLGLLFGHRRWLFAFVVGVAGWGFYIVAVHLAPLSLVQAVSAGGIALIAVFAQRALGERLPRREWFGVAVAVVGLVFLAASLAGGEKHAPHASWLAVGGWFVASWILGGLSVGPLAPLLAPGAGFGLAAGLMYAAADVGTKAAWYGGWYLLLIAPVWACHGLAFTLIQLSFQRGRALATAGLSSFCTNAIPIAAGIAIYHEHVPGGILGALRVLAFVCVVVGAASVARKERVEMPEHEPAYAGEPALGPHT
jgi:drug/metabolite transporter (DMT)-like permease